MFSQQTDYLELLRHTISEQNSQINQLRTMCQNLQFQVNGLQVQLNEYLNEYQESKDFCVNKIHQLDYLSERNKELEYRENYWSLDGDANCNSEID